MPDNVPVPLIYREFYGSLRYTKQWRADSAEPFIGTSLRGNTVMQIN